MSEINEVGTKIRKLEEAVVNKIAAGEIIIQPANALKEMLENSIDAKATMIDIIVKDGGLKLLQITDNGKGIDKQDLSLLCERFATLKLSKFEDLETIATYGFRGEALALISHISRLSVITKSKDSESPLAYKAYYLNGKLAGPNFKGSNVEPKPIAGKDGTQLIVEDLFYNVPSRLKSIRSKNDEFLKILDVVGKYSVHSEGVGFSLKKFGETQHSLITRPNLPLKERIRIVYGSECANELLNINIENPQHVEQFGLIKVNGAISNCNFNYKKKMQSIFFINHRLVSCDPLKRAINSIYQFFLPKGYSSFVYLSLELNPKILDVNVHPTKREVRFLNEDEIIEIITSAIHSTLKSVDSSRSFKTQSLIGLKRERETEQNDDLENSDGPSTSDTSVISQAASTQKKYRRENKMVRVDASQPKLSELISQTKRPRRRFEVPVNIQSQVEEPMQDREVLHYDEPDSNRNIQAVPDPTNSNNLLFIDEEDIEFLSTDVLDPEVEKVDVEPEQVNANDVANEDELEEVEKYHKVDKMNVEETELIEETEHNQEDLINEEDSINEVDSINEDMPNEDYEEDADLPEELELDEHVKNERIKEFGFSGASEEVDEQELETDNNDLEQEAEENEEEDPEEGEIQSQEAKSKLREFVQPQTPIKKANEPSFEVEITECDTTPLILNSTHEIDDEIRVNNKRKVKVSLDSIEELKQEVEENVNQSLTTIINNSSYIGIADETKRLCCFQYDVNLYLCDYGSLLYEYYYQVSLREFCNYGEFELTTPLKLVDLIEPIYLKNSNLLDKSEVINNIINMKDMFEEYFQIKFIITGEEENFNNYCIASLPMIIKNIKPSINKLPYFIYRLGSKIDYQNEKSCLEGIIKQISLLYVPEKIEEDQQQRDLINKFLEETGFPLLKSFRATNNLAKDVIQIADLPGLYKIFERC